MPDGLNLSSGRTAITSILNVTPNSFSDGGRYAGVAAALCHVRAMVAAGTGLIGAGGESARPNSARVSADEEWVRIYTVVELSATDGVVVSMDTLHASIAREAACVGTVIIDDVSGGRRDPEMNAAVTESGCAYVIQHYRALPGTPREYLDYGDDLVDTLTEHVGSQVRNAIGADVTADKIVVDPGLDFSLTGDQYWQILRELPRFLQGGYPVLVGAFRERFVRALDGNMDANSADITAYCMTAGTWAVRVHDVTTAVAVITREGTGVN